MTFDPDFKVTTLFEFEYLITVYLMPLVAMDAMVVAIFELQRISMIQFHLNHSTDAQLSRLPRPATEQVRQRDYFGRRRATQPSIPPETTVVPVVRGPWSVVSSQRGPCGPWSVVCGLWSVVPVVRGPWSVVRGL